MSGRAAGCGRGEPVCVHSIEDKEVTHSQCAVSESCLFIIPVAHESVL